MSWQDGKAEWRNMDKIPGRETGFAGLGNASELLRCARRLKKMEKPEPELRIAVLGSCSIQYFVQILYLLLYDRGIYASVYEGMYDGIRMDILDEGSAFYRFCPDMAILLTDWRDIREFPQLFAEEPQTECCVEQILEQHRKLWEALHEKLPECQVIMSNYVVPVERMLGNLECNYAFSRQSIYRRVNEGLAKIRPPYVLLADMDYLASAFGKYSWFDAKAYVLGKLPFALEYTGYAAGLFAKLIGACRGIVKKCLVLDLDNTLWGGIVSEESAAGIHAGMDDAAGEAFACFQKYVRQLKERGVILAVCSKNEEKDAKEPFLRKPGMILQLGDFSAFYANWDNKAENIRRIAEKLNIGLDSMVFFDDSPAERELVRTQLPMVEVIDVPPEPSAYIQVLEQAGCFHWACLTKEDAARAESYRTQHKREQLLARAGTYGEYLQRLKMRGSIREVQSAELERFAQLINKSNQFNLRTKRHTQAELEALMLRDDCRLLAARLSDKFSSYGIVSCVILRKNGTQCMIDTWVMSCRVLKRGLEYLMFTHMLETARAWGCSVMLGEYLPSQRNGMVSGLLPELGFCLLESSGEACEGGVRYAYDLKKEFSAAYYIQEEAWNGK